MKSTIHLTGLNGLRAIAALAVVFSHTSLGLTDFGLNSLVYGMMSDGCPRNTLLAGFGVSIFFALSGFLITYLLLEEKKVAPINIKNFYMRRILRIWPLYYLYLIASVITLLFYKVTFEVQSILYCTFLFANIPFILRIYVPLLGHYWSLGVEEQFYAFWPWLVKKINNLFRFVVFGAIGLIILKLILHFCDIKYGWRIAYLVLDVTRFQCMLIGAAGGILYFEKNSLFLKLTQHWVSQLIAWAAILLTALNHFHIASVLDNEFISCIAVVLILGQIAETGKLINLENPVFHFLGKISYGIYIIHPIVIFYLQRSIHYSAESVTAYITVYLLVFALTILLAFISYEYFEKRFLKMKLKYSTIVSQ